jgi:hypothetical protein
MVWAGVNWYGNTEVVVLTGRQNVIAYTNTLRAAILPFLENHSSRKLIFQQDNASIHAAQLTRDSYKTATSTHCRGQPRALI